jgi:organic hydroperoxide reductase OsmC/OhrA
MSEHTAKTTWRRGETPFTYDTYIRDHDVALRSGLSIGMSAAAAFRGTDARPNPEDLYVAALSSCHMLTFLAIAARAGLTVDGYDDEASGWLEKGADRTLWMTRAVLRPRVTFAAGTDVSPERLAKLHHDSHEECFIARSVKTEVTVEPKTGVPLEPLP